MVDRNGWAGGVIAKRIVLLNRHLIEEVTLEHCLAKEQTRAGRSGPTLRHRLYHAAIDGGIMDRVVYK